MIPQPYIDFYGDQNRWFIGRVIDITDPLEVGRIKVRVFGIHSENVVDIPDEDLPWAQVVVPITQGGTNSLGNNLGIKVGAHVFGIFFDGKHSQLPLVLGSLPKYEEDSPEGLSTNPLARGTQTKAYTPDSVIGEPDDPFSAIYPNNQVYETESGHVKEYDDTPDATRIRELHRSGTFYQINHDGDLVTHVVRDRYTLVVSDDAVHVKGSVKMFIDQDANITVGGTTTVDCSQVNMTGNLRVDGNVSAGGDVTTDAGVSLNNHTHNDTPGLGAGVTTPPNK